MFVFVGSMWDAMFATIGFMALVSVSVRQCLNPWLNIFVTSVVMPGKIRRFTVFANSPTMRPSKWTFWIFYRVFDSRLQKCIFYNPFFFIRFYIGCENCTDWFHGRCVGILQIEADNIDEYLCPRCDPNSQLNMPNQKQLIAEDYELVKKLLKQLLVRFLLFSFVYF